MGDEYKNYTDELEGGTLDTDLLYDRTQDALNVARDLLEEHTGTTYEKVLSAAVSAVERDAETDLEDLYNFSLPLLEQLIEETQEDMATRAQDEMRANGLGV